MSGSSSSSSDGNSDSSGGGGGGGGSSSSSSSSNTSSSPSPELKAALLQNTEELNYNQKVQAIAEKGIYEFEYVEGPKAGEKVRVQRYKISNRMMLELERNRGEYTALVTSFSDGRGKDKVITKDDRFQAAEMLSNLYSKLAEYYFHIKKEDFELMDWDSSKPNLDAAANVSVRGRPNLV